MNENKAVNKNKVTVDQVEAILPQTQCRKCGFNGCRPYAEALARGEAKIDQCPPGGQAGVDALADLLGIDQQSLNVDFADEKQLLAFIVEADCIGCTRCLPACPVDAIVGASKLMHTVIATECTGCELCIEACPVDCIVMQPAPEFLQHELAGQEKDSLRIHRKKRYQAKLRRQQMLEAERAAKRKASLARLKAKKISGNGC